MNFGEIMKQGLTWMPVLMKILTVGLPKGMKVYKETKEMIDAVNSVDDIPEVKEAKIKTEKEHAVNVLAELLKEIFPTWGKSEANFILSGVHILFKHRGRHEKELPLLEE